MRVIMSTGGVPSALAISVTLGWRSATSTCGVAVASVHPSNCRACESASPVGTRDRRESSGEVQMLLRHHFPQHRGELLGGHIGVHAFVLVRNHDVDTVGMVADACSNPGAPISSCSG